MKATIAQIKKALQVAISDMQSCTNKGQFADQYNCYTTLEGKSGEYENEGEPNAALFVYPMNSGCDMKPCEKGIKSAPGAAVYLLETAISHHAWKRYGNGDEADFANYRVFNAHGDIETLIAILADVIND